MSELVKQLWKGFLAIMFGGGLGVGVWVGGGVQFGRAWSTLAIYCASAILITFFLVTGVEWIIRFVKWIGQTTFGDVLKILVDLLIEKVKDSRLIQFLHKKSARARKISNGINGAANGAKKQLMHKLVRSLLNAPVWALFVAYAIPIIPFIGEAAVIVAKIRIDRKELSIFWVLPALFALAALKAWLTCIVWYHRFS